MTRQPINVFTARDAIQTAYTAITEIVSKGCVKAIVTADRSMGRQRFEENLEAPIIKLLIALQLKTFPEEIKQVVIPIDASDLG